MKICPLVIIPPLFFVGMVLFISSYLIEFQKIQKEIKVYDRGAFALNAKSWMFKTNMTYVFVEIN